MSGPARAPVVWVVAHPTVAQERSAEPLADPAFHHAIAQSRAGQSLAGVIVSEQLAWRRGPGGHAVGQVWAQSGAEVAVIAGPDPRHQADARQLLVDGAASVIGWGRRVHELGATMACWPTILDAPEAIVPAKAELFTALIDSGLDPMLRISVPGTSLDNPHVLGRLAELLAGLGSRGCDLSRLTLCVPMPMPHHAGQGLGARLVDGLVDSVPDQVRAIVVISSRDHLHLAQADAWDLADAISRRSTPWPIAYSAGDMALRAAAAWWRGPELAGDAERRFEKILELLAQPMIPAYTGWPTDDAPATDAQASRATTSPPRGFDTSLFRMRSLFRRPPVQP
jgi:hypothetical protein